MALKFSQKRSYYQNTKKLLANDNFLNCVRDIFLVPKKPVFFPSNDYYVFSTKDEFLNNHKCFYRHTILDEYCLEQAKHQQEKRFQEIHLQRNKNICTIVIGNDLFIDDSQNLEQRLLTNFSGECAKLLDTDLFASNIQNIDNTSAVFHLDNILQYLTQFNYDKIQIVFQMVDPYSCFKSIWWNAIHMIEHSQNDIFKCHPSYQFLSMEDIELAILYRSKEYCSDMHFYCMDKIENGYIILNPHEFFCLYEWSVLDLLKHSLQKYNANFKTSVVAWKDFFSVCNSDNPVPTIQKNLVQFATGESSIPYASNYELINSITHDRPMVILDIKDSWSTKEGKYDEFDLQAPRVFHNVIEPNENTKVLFDNPISTVYNKFDDDWLKITKNNQSQFASYVLKSVGWLK